MQVEFHAAVASESLKDVDLDHVCPHFFGSFMTRDIFGVEWNTFRFEKVCVDCEESLGFRMLLPAILKPSHCKA